MLFSGSAFIDFRFTLLVYNYSIINELYKVCCYSHCVFISSKPKKRKRAILKIISKFIITLYIFLVWNFTIERASKTVKLSRLLIENFDIIQEISHEKFSPLKTFHSGIFYIFFFSKKKVLFHINISFI